jgi:hypothetical protein
MGDDHALVDRLLDQVHERLVAGMAHDRDAGGLGGQGLLELLDHLLRRPARELLVQAVEAEGLGRGGGTGLAGQCGPVAGIAAHLHVHGDALAGRVGGEGGARRGTNDGDRSSAQFEIGPDRRHRVSPPMIGGAAGPVVRTSAMPRRIGGLPPSTRARTGVRLGRLAAE